MIKEETEIVSKIPIIVEEEDELDEISPDEEEEKMSLKEIKEDLDILEEEIFPIKGRVNWDKVRKLLNNVEKDILKAIEVGYEWRRVIHKVS